MSSIFPYVGFNYSSSAPCLGGLPILRSPENGTNRQDILKEEGNLDIAGVVADSTDCLSDKQAVTNPSLEAPVEVAQADTKHKEGARRLNSRIPKNLGYLCLTVATGLIVLSGCIFDAFSKREPNTELLQKLLQTQGVVQPYVGNKDLDFFYKILDATTVPDDKDKGINLLSRTTTPEN